MWTTLQVIFGFLTLLLVFVGNQFSVPILFSAGVACFGLTSLAIGWEAIITRRIVLGWRRRSGRQLYTGIRAVFQGVQFNFLGLFLIVVAFLMYFNNRREVFLQMVRRPGSLLVLLGGLCLLQSMIAFAGQPDSNQGPRWATVTYLLLVRLLPA